MNEKFSDVNEDLPHNIEMEKELLSVMLFKSGASVPKIVDIVTAADFYRPEHRIIFRALKTVYDEKQQTNLLELIEQLKRTGDLDSIGLQYLYALSDIAHTGAYAESYARNIKEKARLRKIIEDSKIILHKARHEIGTADELRADLEDLIVGSAEDKPSTFDVASDMTVDVYQRSVTLSETKGLTGVTTGLPDLNKVTNGLQNAELILLAARPSMGKTALALNIAENAAQKGNVVAVFSLEMSKAQLGARLLSSLSGVECTKINSGNLTEGDFRHMLNALERLDGVPLYVDDTSNLTVSAMRTKARRLKQDKGLDLIVVDYLQLMRSDSEHRMQENRVQEISGISRGLKALAKEFNVPVLALSQLSRNVEMRAEKKPQLSDLRDSGSLEQDADIVMFLYRDEYYNRDEEANQNVAELIVAKNRNGATGIVPLYFQKENTRFTSFIRSVD